MNQAIQFPERECWNAELRAVCFPALVNGFQVDCAMTSEAIATRFGGNCAEEWLVLFREHRWDIEEEVERLIEDDKEGNQEWYWLS